MMDFSYSEAASFYPEYSAFINGKLLVPKTLESGQRLQLLVFDPEKEDSKVLWTSKKITVLSSLTFNGNLGWMAEIDGALAITKDGGVTWKTIDSPISKDDKDNIVGFVFGDDPEYCQLFTTKKIYETADGGVHWEVVNTGEASFNYASIANQERTVICGSHSILINDHSKNILSEYLDREELPIQSCVLLNDKLFIIRGNEIYYSAL